MAADKGGSSQVNYAYNSIIWINTYGERIYMSRPKPNVLLEHVNKKSYKSEQVLEAEAIWAVFYQEKPFNLKILECVN